MSNFNKNIKESSIKLDFFSLSSSSVISQFFSLLCIYILAKDFGAEIFGIYSVFLAYSSIIIILTSLSLEQVYPSLKNRNFEDMVYATLIICIIVSLTIFILFSFFGYRHSFLLGIFVFLNSLGRMGELIAVRSKLFKLVSVLRIIPNIIFLFILIRFTKTEQITTESVIIANIISFSFSWLFIYLAGFLSQVKSLPSIKRILKIIYAERRFIYLVAPSQIFNRLALSIPIIFLERFFGPSIAGQYALINRIGFGPISIIGSAVSQIFLGYLGDIKRGELKNIGSFPYKKVRKNLLIAGLCTLIFFTIINPLIFSFFLSNDWYLASLSGIILAPIIALMLVVFPLTAVFTVYKLHNILFYNQLAFFLLSLFSFSIAAFNVDYLVCIILFSTLSSARYLYLYFKADRIINDKIEDYENS